MIASLPADFLLRLLLCVLSTVATVMSLTLVARRGRDLVFNYVMFGLVIFLISFVLRSTEVSAGFGFGLFAVFGLLRYRTEEMPIRDLTYLLIVIAISMIDAVAAFGLPTLAVLNLLLICCTVLAQWFASASHEMVTRVAYERIELITPARRAELLADLGSRLGVQVVRVEVGDIDFMRDTALLSVWHRRLAGRAEPGHEIVPGRA